MEFFLTLGIIAAIAALLSAGTAAAFVGFAVPVIVAVAVAAYALPPRN